MLRDWLQRRMERAGTRLSSRRQLEDGTCTSCPCPSKPWSTSWSSHQWSQPLATRVSFQHPTASLTQQTTSDTTLSVIDVANCSLHREVARSALFVLYNWTYAVLCINSWPCLPSACMGSSWCQEPKICTECQAAGTVILNCTHFDILCV